MSKITFSFGKNWQNFLKNVDQERIETAKLSVSEFLGLQDLKDKSFLDIGSGSGLFSYGAYLLGAKKIVSFDLDPFSVECTKYMNEKAGKPVHWTVAEGSILNKEFISKLEKCDVVYSFGVLHHTGRVFEAIKNAASLVNNGGYFYIVLYNKGPKSNMWIGIKKFYNWLPSMGKRILEIIYMILYFIAWILQGKNPFTQVKTYKSQRGMDWKTDIIDWLGGYPYEPTTVQEVFNFIKKEFPSFNLLNLRTVNNSGGDWYLFKNEN